MQGITHQSLSYIPIMEDLRDIFNSYKIETIPAKGLTIDIDGIECYGLWGFVKKISLQDKIIYKGIGKSIFVDKNHDLSYYVSGSDWVDSNDCNTSPGTFGYEWGGRGTITNINATDIGSGLSNTNSLIEMNLQPYTPGWYVVWDKIREFRKSHSDNWFLPSIDELNLIYEVKNNLNNLSSNTNLNTNAQYWSSSECYSEFSSTYAWLQFFNSGIQGGYYKNYHFRRSRLCRQY